MDHKTEAAKSGPSLTSCSPTPETDKNVYWNALPPLATSAQIVPAELARRLEREKNNYLTALKKIEKWFGEFPDSGKTWEDGNPMSYGASFGSNGERDFMRQIARAAIEENA